MIDNHKPSMDSIKIIDHGHSHNHDGHEHLHNQSQRHSHNHDSPEKLHIHSQGHSPPPLHLHGVNNSRLATETMQFTPHKIDSLFEGKFL